MPAVQNITREQQPLTWEDDASEKGRRVWLWWRIRVHEVSEYRYLPLVLRLVALVQPSSAGIERVFSQLKLILDACGDSMLEETIIVRLMERVNQKYFPME